MVPLRPTCSKSTGGPCSSDKVFFFFHLGMYPLRRGAGTADDDFCSLVLYKQKGLMGVEEVRDDNDVLVVVVVVGKKKADAVDVSISSSSNSAVE